MIQLDRRIGGQDRYVLTSTPGSLMLVPDEVRKCTVFVGEQAAGRMPRACGTAFFLSRPVEGTDRLAVYCVTANHILERIKANSGDKVLLRLNITGGCAQWVASDLADWVTHPDDQVDVATLRFPMNSSMDHLSLPLTMVVNERRIKDESIGIGDEVFLVGLFSQHHGTERNIPLLRVGNIAAMPEERILSGKSKMDAYLIEARSIGGLSGSPVFVHLGVTRLMDGQVKFANMPMFYLLGLMHGHWDRPDSELDAIDEDSSCKKEKVNMGIAIVVPVDKILEVLDQDLNKAWEEEIASHWRASNSPVAD
jgi:hypothetical protein